MRSVWHVYYGTRGYAGNYIHAVQGALQESGIPTKAFVSARYRFDTVGVVRLFFPVTDRTARRTALIKGVRALELAGGYAAILFLALISRPRVNLSLIDDTLITYLFFRACKLLRLHVDVTCHDVWTHEATLPGRRRRLFRMADRLVVHSRSAAGQLGRLDRTYLNKTVHVPFPFSFGSLRLEPKLKARARNVLRELSAGESYCLFLGVVRRSKGVEDLLAAWETCAASERRKLVIAGKWGRQDRGIKARALGMRNCVLMDWYLADEEFSALLEGASFVVLPYREYTHSSIYYACAESGVPVITSDIGLFRELHPTPDLMFEGGRVEALARAIDRAFTKGPDEVAALRAALQRSAAQARNGLAPALKHAYA